MKTELFTEPGEGEEEEEEEEEEEVFLVTFLWAVRPFLLLSEDLSEVR
jgi:hypothetical protein